MADDFDKTVPPRRMPGGNADDVTMPGKRDRKPDGRFEPGDLILNRYKVVSELGQGGMGVVYKCFDETGGIEVALKALPPELSHNTLEMEDIKENFQLVAKLIHQNIAISKNLEKDNSNGNYYLIMECVEGEDLRRWIKRKRKEESLTLETVLPVIRQVADALDYAHRQRVIHRDIKPGNIMISADGSVKVLDFGLAAQIHTSMTRVSMAYHGTSGTGPYMAPEQWRGRAQGANADQYALAVMTYEMLAGHLPFESADAAVLREAVLNDTAEAISGMPKAVQDAVSRAMCKDPSQRFESCGDFVAALGGNKVKRAKPAKIPGAKSSSGKIAAVLLVFLIVAGAAGYGIFEYRKAEERRIAEKRAEEKKQQELLTEENYKLLRQLRIDKSKIAAARYDRGETFGKYLDAFQECFEIGEAAMNAQNIAIANANFKKAQAAAAWLFQNDVLRKKAKELSAAAAEKKRVADGFDAAKLTDSGYHEAEQFAAEAERLLESADFEGAYSSLQKAVSGYENACTQARRERISGLLSSAEQAKQAKNWENVKKYAGQLRTLDAVKSRELTAFAEKAVREEAIETGLSKARDAKKRKAWQDVSYFAASVLAVDSGNAEARQLQEEARFYLITNDEQLKKYLLGKCDVLAGKTKDYQTERAMETLKKFDFKDFNAYKNGSEERSLISDAILIGADWDIIRYLAEKKNLSVNKVAGYSQKTPIFAAVQKDRSDITEYLISKGADVNFALESDQSTPLFYAQSVEMAKLLLKHGADMSRRDKKKKTIPDRTTYAVAHYLWKNGAEFTDPKDLYRKAAYAGELAFLKANQEKVKEIKDIMVSACRSGSAELIQYLESCGCSYDVPEEDGDSVLHCSSSDKVSFEVYHYIFERTKVDVNSKNKWGRTPLHNVTWGGKDKIRLVRLLLDKGVDVNAADEDGNTVLMLTIQQEPDFELIKFLAEIGADIRKKNKSGKNSLSMAAGSKKPEITRYLLEKCGISKRNGEYNVSNVSEFQAVISILDGGETIRMKNGIYELDSYTAIQKNCRIVGEGIDNTKIIAQGDIRLKANNGEKKFYLKDLLIDYKERNMYLEKDSIAILENCKIINGKYWSIYLEDNSILAANNCTLGTLHMGENAYVVMNRSTIHEENRSAIWCGEEGGLFMNKCSITGNDKYGTVYLNENSMALLLDSRFYNIGSGPAVNVGRKNKFLAEGCDFSGGDSAIDTSHDSALLNRCSLTSRNGFGIQYVSSQVKYYKCKYNGPKAFAEGGKEMDCEIEVPAEWKPAVKNKLAELMDFIEDWD